MKTRGSRFLIALSVIGLLALVSASCAPGALPTPPPARAVAPSPTSAPAPTVAVAPTPGVMPTRAPALTPMPAPPPAPAGEAPKYGGVLTLAVQSEPQMLDPHQEASIYTLWQTGPASNMLVQQDPMDETRTVGDLAKSWEVSPDGLIYTFRLHEGVKFHNGYPATAEDAKYSLERMARPPKGVRSPRQLLFRNVEKFEAVDSNTLRITLKHPQASLLGTLAMEFNAVLSKRFIEEQKGNITWNLVGTGPFKVKEYIRGISVEHEKNPDYFIKGRPYLDGLRWYLIPDPGAMKAAIRTGRALESLSAGSPISLAEADILKKEVSGIKVLRHAGGTTAQISFNTKRKPWDDVRVRKAVDLVIDRQAAVEILRKGSLIGGYLQPGTPWAMPQEELLKRPGFRQPKDQDIAEAKKLMAEAGYAGKTMEVTIPTRNLKAYIDLGVFAKGELAKLGIETTVKPLDVATMSKILFAHDMDILPYSEGFASYDPDVIFGDFYVTGALRNYGEWSDPRVDELYARQSQTMDPAKRVQLVREMEKLAMEGVSRASIFWHGNFTLEWPQVRNRVQPNTLYLNLKWQDVWLAQ